MKKHICVLMLLFIATLPILSSCSSDNDSAGNQNSVNLDGQPFSIVNPIMAGVSINGTGHIGASLFNQNGSVANVLTIDFEYFADQAIEGDYAYPETEGVKKLTSITNYTEFVINGNTTETKSFTISEGTFALQDNGEDNYTLTMDLILTNSQEERRVFKGTYTGDFMVQINNGTL